jgi:hypothetical protein
MVRRFVQNRKLLSVYVVGRKKSIMLKYLTAVILVGHGLIVEVQSLATSANSMLELSKRLGLL